VLSTVSLSPPAMHHTTPQQQPLYAVDHRGRIVFCNAAFADLVGERAEDVVGRLSLMFYPADAAPLLLRQRVDALLHDGSTVVQKTQMLSRDGHATPVQLSVMSLGGEGHIIGHLVQVCELASGAAAAPAPPSPKPVLEHLARLSAQEADALPYGLIVLDAEGVVTGYNAAESRLSGLPRTRVIGRDFFRHVAPCTHVRGLGELYGRMVETGEPESAQLDFVFRFPGGERPVFIVMAYVAALDRGLLLIDPR
jgi:photoactive yellow protein